MEMEGDAEQLWRRRRTPGKTQRRKRSLSRGADADNYQDEIKRIVQNERSSFHFNVEIPAYYNDAPIIQAHGNIRDGDTNTNIFGKGSILEANSDDNDTPRSKNDGNPGGKSTRKNEPDLPPGVASPTSQQAEAKAKPVQHVLLTSGKGRTKAKAARRDEHNAFITALEKHGSSPGAWSAMATELEWTVDDVKVHAYSYFKTLLRKRNVISDNLPIANDGRNKTPPHGMDQLPWSFEELILLDSLMLKYCEHFKQTSQGEMSSGLIRRRDVWEKIAAQFPGRTAAACKKSGIPRLLEVCAETLSIE